MIFDEALPRLFTHQRVRISTDEFNVTDKALIQFWKIFDDTKDLQKTDQDVVSSLSIQLIF